MLCMVEYIDINKRKGEQMKLIKKFFLIITPLVIIGIIVWNLNIYLPDNAWNIIETVGTVLGVLLVIVELKESKDLSEGSFVSGLTDSFNNNKSIQYIYKKLELNQEITDDDTIDIVAYLTYFETIYVLLKKKAIDIALIDDLFAYRFRLALTNDTFRRISLVRYDSAYVNIYNLEKKWCDFKKKDSVLEQHNPNYLIVLRGNKMKKNDILFGLATKEDAKEIHELMEEVYEKLEDKSLYVCDGLEYVNTHISGEGFAVKACNYDGKIVGSFIFRYPGMQDDNLGRDIGLEEGELPKVVHMESAVVLPEYRGRGIQYKMLKYAEELIDKNQYKYFMATVSPNNPASYKSFEKNGYEIKLTKEKYDGLTRRIYLKKV